MTKLNILSLSFLFFIDVSSFAQQENSPVLSTSLNNEVGIALNKTAQNGNKSTFTQSDYILSTLVNIAGTSTFADNKMFLPKSLLLM